MKQKDNDFDFNEIEMADPDSFQYGNKDAVFNHAILVMRAYQKAQDCLAKEKVEGFWETRLDNRGNQVSVYHPDTRKEAIEAVKTLKNCMVSDIKDLDYEMDINLLIEIIDDKYDEFVGFQRDWWKGLGNDERVANKEFYASVRAERLFIKGNFYQEYLSLALDIYREIFEQLEFALNSIRYFKKKAIEA